MKPLVYLVITFLFFASVQAQTPKIDSLDRLISRATTDTARINLVNKKITQLVSVNIDSAVSLSLKNIQRAKQINYKQGEALARLRLAYCSTYKGDYASVKENLKIAGAIYGSLGDSVHLLDVYSTYGTMYGMQSKYDSAITFFEKHIATAERNKYKTGLGNAYLSAGIAYEMLSNRPQALRHEQKALTLAEADHNLHNQVFCLVNMGNLYKGMRDWKGAEQRYTRAIQLAQEEGMNNIVLYAYANVAEIYQERHDYTKSYNFAMKAASLGKQTGDKIVQATSLSTAALNLAKQKRFTEAETLDRQAIAIADSSQQPLNIHHTYSTMGSILKMQGKYAAAIPYYEKSFAVLEDADIYDAQTGEAYKDLSECYEKTGDFRRALATNKRAAAIADSVRGKENIQKATELSMNYEFDKKEQAARAEQQKQNAIARAKQWALITGLALMVMLAAVSFYAYRTKHKANTLLEEQKNLLQLQKEQLEHQKEQLETTLTELKATQRQLVQAEKMATMGKLTKGIVDRILNPLNYINNFSLGAKDLLKELLGVVDKHLPTFSNDDQDDLEDTTKMLNQNLEKINEHGNSTARILKDMQKLLKEKSATFAVADINQLLEQHISTSLQTVLSGYSPALPVKLTFHLDKQPLDVSVLALEFRQVLSSLVDNSCYSLLEKSRRSPDFVPQIEVTTQLIDDQVQILFRDNGRGIAAKEMAQLFSPFFTTKPTAKGTGLGLYMSRDVIEYLQGQMNIDSVEGEFTQVTITLPLAPAENLVS